MLSNHSSNHWSARIGRVLLGLLTLLLAVSWAVPVVWALVASLRPANDPLGPRRCLVCLSVNVG